MTRYWFKRRRFGYGWTPATREGWLTMVGYLVLAVGGAIVLGAFDSPGWAGVVYLLALLALTVALMVILVKKGPAPKWRWGRAPGDDPGEDF